MRWVRHLAHIGEINAYKILVVKSEGKRTLGRPRRRWEDNTRTDLGKMREEVWTGCM
jgi:hypothetical protein